MWDGEIKLALFSLWNVTSEGRGEKLPVAFLRQLIVVPQLPIAEPSNQLRLAPEAG